MKIAGNEVERDKAVASIRSYAERYPGGGSNSVGLTILVDRPEAWNDPPPDRHGEVNLYAQRQQDPRQIMTLSFQGHYSRMLDADGVRPAR